MTMGSYDLFLLICYAFIPIASWIPLFTLREHCSREGSAIVINLMNSTKKINLPYLHTRQNTGSQIRKVLC